MGGKKSFEDFARIFFGIRNRDRTYYTNTLESLCDALNQVASFNWRKLLRNRFDTHSDDGLLDRLTRGCGRLIFIDVPTGSFRQSEDDAANLTYSIGLSAISTAAADSAGTGSSRRAIRPFAAYII